MDDEDVPVNVLEEVPVDVEAPLDVPLRVDVGVPYSDTLDVLVLEVVVVCVCLAEDVPVLDCVELPVTVFVCKVEGEMELDGVGLLVPWEVLLMELVALDERVRAFPLLEELLADVDFVGNEVGLEDELLLGLLVPFGEAVEVDDDDLETVVLDERLEVEEPDEDLELAALTDDTELAEDVLVVDTEDVPLLVDDEDLDVDFDSRGVPVDPGVHV